MIAAGLVLSGVCLYYFIPRLVGHWPEVVRTFRRANYLYLVPAIGLIGVLYACRVLRWRLFLSPIKRVRVLSVTSATCIGFMANCVLPARAGELIRPYVVHRREGVSFAHALATAAGLERVFDLIGLSVLMLVTWFLMGAAGGTSDTVLAIWKGSVFFAAIAAAGCLALVALALFPRPVLKAGEWCTRFLPSRWRDTANGFGRSVVEAMGFIRSWRGVLAAGVYSVGLWVAQGLSCYALGLGLGLELGVSGSFFVAIAVAVAVALPQLPGYVGPFHVAAAVAAESFQAGTGEAQAFALLMWLVNVVPITLVGLGFLWHEGFRLGELASASSALKETDVPAP